VSVRVMRGWRRRSDLRAANAVKAKIPHCGAKCRGGTRCRNPGAGAGGRCHRHGGLTPSGKNWHRVMLPKDDGPRRDRKIAALAKRRRQRAERLAAMTDDERQAFERRSRAAQPRTKAERETQRRDREAREILERPRTTPVTPDPEVIALEAQLAEVRAHRARLKALLGDQISTQEQFDE
jgi:hypothetical protein